MAAMLRRLREHTLNVGDVFAQAVKASVSKSVSNRVS